MGYELIKKKSLGLALMAKWIAVFMSSMLNNSIMVLQIVIVSASCKEHLYFNA